MSREGVGVRDALLAVFGLGLLGAAAFGSHIGDGGFSNDDWTFLRDYRFADGAVDQIGAIDDLTWRVGETVLYSLEFVLLGDDPAGHLAVTLATAVAMSTALFVLLVTLGVARWHAIAIAALVLIYPYSDATRLWARIASPNVAIALFLMGAVLSLRAFDAAGRRATALHCGGVALYAAGMATYEVVAAPMAATLFLYRLRVPWRPSLRRWAVDVAAVLLVYVLVSSNSFYDPVPLTDLPDRVGDFAREGSRIFATSAVPFGAPTRLMVGVVAAAIAAVGVALARKGDEPLRRWLVVAAAGAVVIAVGYGSFLLAEDLTGPLAPGQANRVNVFAGMGHVLLVYSLAVVASLLLARLAGGRQVVARGATGAVALVLATGYINRIQDDKAVWAQAQELQRDMVTAISATVDRPPAGSVLYAFEARFYAAPGVPAFASLYDLSAALHLQWDTQEVRAYPMHSGTRLACGRESVTAHNLNDRYGRPQLGGYGKTWFVSVEGRRARRIDSRAECRSAARRFGMGG